MTKRITWFVAGAAAGVAGTSYAGRKIKAKAAQLAPARVMKGAATRVRGRGRRPHTLVVSRRRAAAVVA